MIKFIRTFTVVLTLILLSNNLSATSSNYTKVSKYKKQSGQPVVEQLYTMSNSDCLTINTFKEASIGTEKEQKLINAVVLNRVLLNGGTACSQVFAKKQFSWTIGLNVKYKFKNKNDMLAYYNVPESSYNKLSMIVADSILEHSVLDYKSKNKKIDTAIMYHDKSVKKFPGVKKSDVKVLGQTKNFVWYTTDKLSKKVS